MVFSSIPFLFYFLPIFLVAYALLPWKNWVLSIASLIFYIWGEGYFAFILLLSVAFNFVCGHWIARAHEGRRRTVLAIGIVLNLALLLLFKYAGFLAYDVLRFEQAEQDWVPRLPVGISFFTFQAISYLIDVYRRQAEPANSALGVMTYITMFPQLIAGPIVRYSTVAARIKKRMTSLRHVYFGFLYFSFGMAQKVLIADTMAAVVDPIFALPHEEISMALAWTGALAYTMQIYFDFAGYSNMAIGLGLILGFKFPRNFNYPYVSLSITEFWRRWHMSLSSWFRDYLYIPLGGNRLGRWKTYRNLFTVFLLCGLWHGAAWTFIAWGLYHGLLLTLERIGKENVSLSIPAPAAYAYAMLMTVIGWVIFRAESFSQAGVFLGAMFGFGGAAEAAQHPAAFVSNQAVFVFLIALVAGTGLMERFAKLFMLMPRLSISDPDWRSPRTLIALGVATTLLAMSSILILAGSYSAFIYFRF